MKNCTKCKYAQWHKTEVGRLHPSGDGKCTKEIKIPPLPASKQWPYRDEPKPTGGWINRREELKEHCVYYSEQSK